MSSAFDGFVPIHTIFYTLFHPTEGSKVRFQFPPNSLENGQINFDTIKNYVIPKPQLCNKLLTFKYGNFRLVCYPVNVNAGYYARNSFNFNFVFVFPYECATSPYEPAIARLGKMFRVLEEQSQILSKAEQDSVYFGLKTSDAATTDQSQEIPPLALSEYSDANASNDVSDKYREIMLSLGKEKKSLEIEDLIMKLYVDLNNYSECLIPIDEGNSIDIKLFPVRTPPSTNISVEDVPIAIVNLPSLIDVNWDPTMVKIVPFINGINSIAQIASCAQSDVSLVVECIRHLLYFRCIVISDIFQFGNIYAPTSELHQFLTDPSVAKSCQLFVQSENNSKIHLLPYDKSSLALYPNGKKHMSSSTINTRRRDSTDTRTESFSSIRESERNLMSTSSVSSLMKGNHYSETLSVGTDENLRKALLPKKSSLFDLYRSLSQGKSVKEWYKQNFEIIRDNRIDVRKFVTFGVTRRLIYRVHSYPVVKNVGTWDVLRTLTSSESRLGLKQGSSGKNVFSTADIEVDVKASGSNIKARNANSEAVDELLKNLYEKLSLKKEGSNATRNLFSRYFDDNDISDSTGNSRKSSTGSHQKVAFDFGSQRPKTVLANESSASEKTNGPEFLKKKRFEEVALLDALRNAETLDKICTDLRKDRHDVEVLLSEIGHCNIINS